MTVTRVRPHEIAKSKSRRRSDVSRLLHRARSDLKMSMLVDIMSMLVDFRAHPVDFRAHPVDFLTGSFGECQSDEH